MSKFIAIIPARFASTRFPGKPLAIIDGKPMIQHVYECCAKVLGSAVAVATDDKRIADAVTSFGGTYVFTSLNHPSGTDRCAEAARILQEKFDFDYVINVQGDEPFMKPRQLEQIISCFDDGVADIATLVSPIVDNEVLFNINKVKVVTASNGNALYFSRQAIPFVRDVPQDKWLEHRKFYLHIGMYAFKKDVLQQIVKYPQSGLELSEKLEQLRWLENGYCIKTAETKHQSIGIDTPDDLENARKMMSS